MIKISLISYLRVARPLVFLLHRYIYIPSLGNRARKEREKNSLALRRCLHMSAEDDNYGGFGLPFAVVVVAAWASINLALNFVRCPPTQSLPCAACL